jgi:hypothetical protein
MKTEHDHKLIRCPKLGDEMTFAYCLWESGDMPCARIVSCWSYCFDIAAFLKEILAPEKWNNFINFRPNEKVINIVELIEAAKAKK